MKVGQRNRPMYLACLESQGRREEDDMADHLSRCPLCGSRKATRFFETRDKHGHREFEHCPECDMVSVPRRAITMSYMATEYRYTNDGPKPEFMPISGVEVSGGV